MFEKELEYYQVHKDELLKHYENQFVVIKGKSLLGSFTTDREAYEAGLREYGNVSFLIKKVTKEEEIVRFPALALGLSLGIGNADT